MPTYRLRRQAQVDLVFDGVRLAARSSRTSPDQTEWTEVRLYRTDSGRYVGEPIGRSTDPAEKDMLTVRIVDDVKDVAGTLERGRPDTRLYLTDMALDVLDEAAEVDPAIAEAAAERI